MASAQNAIPQNLHCPVCFEVPSEKVFQCRDGHILCEECYIQVDNCPQCRVAFDRNPIRNRAVEAMLSDLQSQEKQRIDLTRKSEQYLQEDFSDNTNSKIDITNSKPEDIVFDNNSNSDFKVSNSRIFALSNMNITVNGQEVDTTMLRNNYCRFEGIKCEWFCSSNINCEFIGNESNINATNNTNLRIAGDGNNIQVNDTSNHYFRPSNKRSPIGAAINEIEIVSDSISTCHFNISYVNRACIEENKYKMGLFKFEMNKIEGRGPGELYNLIFDVSELNENKSKIITQKLNDSEMEILMTGVGSVEKERILLKGEKVEIECDGGNSFFIMPKLG